MKKINKYFFSLFLSIVLFTSCDKGFDQMNINPIAMSSVDPTFQLNNAFVGSAHTYGNLSYEVTIVKQMITPFSGQGAAGNFNQSNPLVNVVDWQKFYRNVIRELVDVIQKTKDDPSNSNLYNMARIWKAYSFMVLTDTYGDIPYFNAGLGYLDGTVKPAYDSQESVYTDILKELDTASAALDASKPKVTREILYAGDISKWKRLGYSLLLRGAMRLSKVKPAIASGYVTKAVAGGLMQSNDDNAIVRHTSNFPSDVGANLNGGNSAFFYLSEDFVTNLQSNNDPRLVSIAVRYKGATNSSFQVETNANRTSAVQIGMPLGYDNTTIATVVKAKGLASLWDFSQLDRTRMGSQQAPDFFITYSQTLFLMAEAVVRNWTTGNATTLYADGIKANMKQLSSYGTNTAITDSNIDIYLAAHPLDLAQAMQQINTQYWIASFLNGPEAFANFRRSGFPALTPNLYPGSDLKTESFIRRITYPDSEHSVNTENINLAVSKQGSDILDTRVWWDVK